MKGVSAMIGAASLLAFASSARADGYVYSLTQEELVGTYSLASGEQKHETLAKGVGVAGVTNVSDADARNPSLRITFADGSGHEVARGTVRADRAHVLVPNGSGRYTLIDVGFVGKGARPTYPGIVVVNTLPDNYTVDLFATSGERGFKNVKVSRSFGLQDAIRVPADDTSYRIVIRDAQGHTVDSSPFDVAKAGAYVVIHKGYGDVVTASRMGQLEAPKK